MINSIAPTQIPTLKEVDPKADMRCDIPIRLHYCSESHHEYQSQKAQISVGAISPDDDIEERLEQSQLTLSVEASRYLLAHISYAYFDYGIDVVHTSVLPYKGKISHLPLCLLLPYVLNCARVKLFIRFYNEKRNRFSHCCSADSP
ncbi:hypothetical protein [Vibrio sp. 1F279]|uniref:hypothetical protein n=1 Tax=unclassified Vibrio TaxID=2614977 RepID=UPI00352FC33B